MTKVEKYKVGDDWESYCEQLDFHFIAKDITDGAKKKASLLAALPQETYQLVKDLVAPTKVTDVAVTYEIIVKKVQEHIRPEKNPLVARKELDDRTRKSGESVQEYVAALKHLAQECKFTDGARKERLRDRILSGIQDDDMVKALLKVKFEDLTLDVAISTCVAEEQAKKDTKAIVPQAVAVPVAVNMVKDIQTSKQLTLRSKPVKDTNVVKDSNVEKDTNVAKKKKCYRCGDDDHGHWECRFKRENCFKCGKRGHTQAMCKKSAVNLLEPVEDPDELDLEVGTLFNVDTKSQHLQAPMNVKVNVDGKTLEMVVDTAASVSVMGLKKWEAVFTAKRLAPSKLTLCTYTGEDIQPVGMAEVLVNGTLKLPIYVVSGDTPTLLGRNWLSAMSPDWRNKLTGLSTGLRINAVGAQLVLEDLLTQYKELFEPGLGKLNSVQAKLEVKEDVKPKFLKARPVPLALQPKVEAELEKLKSMGVIEPVMTAEWGAPMVNVIKRNGQVRLCGDFKVTVNPQLKIDQHPLPRVEEIFAKLSGGIKFTKLDLRDAYFQMEVEESSRKYLTVNTCKGLFRYCRLPFGIASAPALWQRAMDQSFAGLPVQCYLDDLVVTGKTTEEHLQNLDCVLRRIQELGLKLNQEKCKFLQDSIEYCGHIITKDGLQQAPVKVSAMIQMPPPTDVKQLRAFIGMVQYYARFIPNLSHRLHPLLQLLVKGAKWSWGQQQDSAFNDVKQELASNRVLTHYSQDLPLSLACDSSAYGVGAVLSHTMEDGSERPIAYASRTLNAAEKNYAQIEKEALALVWGTKKFSQYLMGRQFTLVTDHQPLKFLMNENRGVSATAAARIQRWCLYLGQFSYNIVFRGTAKHGNCDGLSRLPQEAADSEASQEDLCDVFVLDQSNQLPVSAKDVAKESAEDMVIAKVMEAVYDGSCKVLPNNELFKPFINRFDELSLMQNCLLWGMRVVVPPKLQEYVLRELHSGHEGIVKMKSRARRLVWWPTLDSDIDGLSRSCEACLNHANNPPKEYGTWPQTTRPLERVHVDFGDYKGQMFLILVDTYSKWPEVVMMSSTTAQRTVTELRTIFARLGIPEVLVSDNGPQFSSEVFRDFMRANGVLHLTSPAYHPATNGQAEKGVGIIKQALRKLDSSDLRRSLDVFLHAYRNTPHTATNRAPAEMMIGRPLRSRLDLIRPTVQPEALSTMKSRSFTLGQQVKARAYLGPKQWITGVIQEILGPKTYVVEMLEKPYQGFMWRRHVNQLRDASGVASESVTENVSSSVHCGGSAGQSVSAAQSASGFVPSDDMLSLPEGPTISARAVNDNDLTVPDDHQEITTQAEGTPVVRRSQRVSTKPQYLKDYEV